MNILVLEASYRGSDILRRALVAEHRLTVVDTVDKALDVLASRQIELVITNVYLCEENAFRLLLNMRADPTLKDLPFVCFVNAQSEFAHRLNPQIARSFLALGAAAYLTADRYLHDKEADCQRLREDVECLGRSLCAG